VTGVAGLKTPAMAHIIEVTGVTVYVITGLTVYHITGITVHFTGLLLIHRRNR
jgi:hypothetical protein